MSDNYYKSDHVEIEVKEGILHARYTVEGEVDLALAKQIVEERTAFTLPFGRKMPILLDAQSLTEVTKEARDYWATREAAPDILVGAIMLGNSVNRMMVNMWFRVSKPVVPTKLFSPNDQEGALKWLRKMQKKLDKEEQMNT